ncbi:hypothetical protein B0T20DRAFT_398337 [Sordaria brevicollis]|uniref:Uncharacterized protein n=1 Tax=Sordaria brevicollis TaxID=83679 RepID=A0AAE0PM65_SORBR|nr:hypothetical protein B0T20DRAFT_398337 [Sordaria brevicollis]
MCHKYTNAEYSCKHTQGCQEVYQPYFIQCAQAKKEGPGIYCEAIRCFDDPMILPVDCGRHMVARLEELKRLFQRLFATDVQAWAKVGTAVEFQKEREAARARTFDLDVLSENYENAKDSGTTGFYSGIITAIHTHLSESIDHLKEQGLTRITPAESSSDTKESKDKK